MKKTLIAVLAALAIGSIALAAGPAVSDFNTKIDGAIGWIDGDGAVNFTGSATFPVGNPFGAQIDGLYGWTDDESLYGLGGHFFWRNPEYALLGATAAY